MNDVKTLNAEDLLLRSLELLPRDLQAWSELFAEDAVFELPYADISEAPTRRDGREAILAGMTWFVSLLNASLPPFWTGLIFLTIFYFNLGIAPGPGRLDSRMPEPMHVTGLMTVDSILSGNWAALASALSHLVLPTLILGGFTLALVVRVTRAAIIEEMRRDYVRTARGKGLSERNVIVRHALRNVLIPLVTILGLAFAGLLSGAVMTETVFDWPGLGQYLVKAAVNLDYPAIQAGTLLIAFIYVLINLLVDILYGVLDPRVRYE